MTAYLLTIGDEILIGQVVDTNSVWLSQQFNLNGIRVVGKATVSDTHEAIFNAVSAAMEVADIVITTGGLGPTKDDITKKVLAELFESDMEFHQATYDFISDYFQKIGRKVPDAMRHQATLPTKAEILPNGVGSAPGMWFDLDGKAVVSLPGVPHEMKHLITEQVLPRIKSRFATKPLVHRTILTCGEGESAIAERLEQFENDLPKHIKLAYLPSTGQVRLRLSGVWNGAADVDGESLLEAEVNGFTEELKAILGPLVFGEGKQTLPEVVGALLLEKGLTLGSAESCTGGHVAHQITTIPGSSAWYPGSVVTYSYELKTMLLGVKPETLATHGAVSEECVVEMSEGLLKRLGCDVSVAISGIAGPGGGLPNKPVGTVWMAVSDKNRTVAKLYTFGQDRLKNIERSSTYALNMVRRFLEGTI